MSDPSFSTYQLVEMVDRIQAGDMSAQDELLQRVGTRLERLARKMLGRFPSVRRWADTGDVLQNAAMRLLRALTDVRPGSTREFFGLAAEQMRRELLDLSRQFYGPHGVGANHASRDLNRDSNAATVDPPDPADSDELERWCAFHEAVEQLPAEEREVVGLASARRRNWTMPRRWTGSASSLLQAAVQQKPGAWKSARMPRKHSAPASRHGSSQRASSFVQHMHGGMPSWCDQNGAPRT
jgi:RNA polymerase sigma-70 factor (ECF subfamily)